ncbi:MAG: hypothetical protein V3S05_03185 [Desulfobacterales bacterium]
MALGKVCCHSTATPRLPVVRKKIQVIGNQNECLGCHEEGDEETPGISPSHKIKAVVKSVSREESSSGMLRMVSDHAKIAEGINNDWPCT